jgi:hypothetical protein
VGGLAQDAATPIVRHDPQLPRELLLICACIVVLVLVLLGYSSSASTNEPTCNRRAPRTIQ